MAHDANKHGHGHGDHHPDGGDPAGELQLILVADGHKAHQNVGHAEVAKAPGQHGNNADQTVRLRLAGGGVIGLTKAQKTGNAAGMGQNSIHTAGLHNAEHHDDAQSDGHNHRLDQVHGGDSAEAAHGGIADDDDGAHDHGEHIIPAEQTVEQLADRRQTGGHIGHEEHQNDERGDTHNDGLFLPVALGDKAGDGDGVQFHAVTPQAAGYQQEIQVGADGKADGGPAGVRHAAEIGEAGDTHEQVAAHIAGLRAHGRDQGAHAPAAEVKAFSALLASFTDHHAGENHQAEIQNDRCHDRDLCGCHTILSPLTLQCLVSYHNANKNEIQNAV